jgi:hypothetical protein
LELGLLGVAKKLVKDIIHLWRQDFERKKKKILSLTSNNHFGVSKDFWD